MTNIKESKKIIITKNEFFLTLTLLLTNSVAGTVILNLNQKVFSMILAYTKKRYRLKTLSTSSHQENLVPSFF